MGYKILKEWDVVMVVGWGIMDREARWDVEGA